MSEKVIDPDAAGERVGPPGPVDPRTLFSERPERPGVHVP